MINKKIIPGQISVFEKTHGRAVMHCGECICDTCLMWWSGRCPYGSCYDDHMAEVEPYDKAHTGVVRKQWSEWNRPGEQAHWCRGGIFYGHSECEHYVQYKGSRCEDCLKAVVQIFQDGYISCTLVDQIGCERCYEEFERKEMRGDSLC